MKRMIMAALMLTVLLLTGCSALPSEEKSFAVVLGVSREGEAWRMYARVPTYQTGGGYATVSGGGDSILTALSDLDDASPMQLDLGQLRMVLVSEPLAGTEAFPALLTALSDRHDMRQQAVVCITTEAVPTVMDAMNPSSGARLSKSLDVLLAARREQGIVLPAELSRVILMGERQCAVLPALSLKGKALSIDGGYPVNGTGMAVQPLNGDEMKLISLMSGYLKSGVLSLPEGSVILAAASAKAGLSVPDMQAGDVQLKLRCSSSDLTEDALEQCIANACLAVLRKLSDSGCDALGLGRDAVRQTETMAQWHELNWPQRYASLVWRVSVGVNPPA